MATFIPLAVQPLSSIQNNKKTETSRRSADYPPSLFTDDFIQSLSSKYGEAKYKKEAESLEDYVRSLLLKENRNAYESLELVDTVERLGLGYLFERDFPTVLAEKVLEEKNEGDLHYTALRFRILRQYGFMVPEDELTPFLDMRTGAFREDLKNDIKVILSLYDASFISLEGEKLLDDARSFCLTHLREYCMKENTENELHELVKHGLELPHYWRHPKLDARWFITLYERKMKKDLKLLELAKLVYNLTQAHYQSLLKYKSKWWKDHGLAEYLPFIRDRLPECFLWAIGSCFRPQYSLVIEGMTLVTQFITAIDDIYDVFGTIEELELFTNAVDRWNLSELEGLPEYMRPCFLALYNMVNDIAYHALKNQGLNVIPILSKLWADLFKGYLVEAKWFHKGYTPNFEEYMNTAMLSIALSLTLANIMFLMNEKMTKEKLDLIKNYGGLLDLSISSAFRLVNDMGTSKCEVARGDVSKAVLIYMHDKRVSEEVAVSHMNNLIDESWKKLNMHVIMGSPFSRESVAVTVDFLRAAHWYYYKGDSFGTGKRERTIDMFNFLLVEPIPMELAIN